MKKIIALTLSLLLLIPIFTVASSALDFAPSPKASSYVENRLLIEIAEPENESNICRLDSIYNFVEYKTVFEHDEAETDKDTVYCVTFADSYDVCEVKREIEEYSFVKSVSLDYIGEFCGVVDDSSAEAVASKSWYFNDLNVKDAWDACDKKDNEVVVAVIDSGFDVDNPAIHDSLVPLTSNNETYYCYNAATQTYGDPGAENHGTAVASTIVAQTQNTAINGIASNLKNGDGKNLVKVLAICIADQADSTMTVSALIRAFDFLNKYVADGSNHVDIVSLSLSFTVDERNAMLSPDEIDELGGIISIISENFIVIAAAGNDMQSTSENASYPAQLSDVIGVMGYDIDGKLWKELDWDSPLKTCTFTMVLILIHQQI